MPSRPAKPSRMLPLARRAVKAHNGLALGRRSAHVPPSRWRCAEMNAACMLRIPTCAAPPSSRPSRTLPSFAALSSSPDALKPKLEQHTPAPHRHHPPSFGILPDQHRSKRYSFAGLVGGWQRRHASHARLRRRPHHRRPSQLCQPPLRGYTCAGQGRTRAGWSDVVPSCGEMWSLRT